MSAQSPLPERVATLEEKGRAQDKVNADFCALASELVKKVQRIEVILALIGAGVGLDRALTIMGLIHP